MCENKEPPEEGAQQHGYSCADVWWVALGSQMHYHQTVQEGAPLLNISLRESLTKLSCRPFSKKNKNKNKAAAL